MDFGLLHGNSLQVNEEEKRYCYFCVESNVPQKVKEFLSSLEYGVDSLLEGVYYSLAEEQ